VTDEAEAKVLVAEERLRVEKHPVVTGRVLIETRVDTIEEIARATLEGEVVEIERVSMDEVVTAVPEVRTEGDVTIIPIVEEVLVVEKRLVLTEELRIRRRSETQEVEVPVTLRRQRAEVRRQADKPQET
jgi:uncharacterized protein (TIGR02271 family)